MHSVLGTILDPAADKALMTTLTVTLAMKGCLPGVSLLKICRLEDLTKAGVAPVAVVILGRDILLVLAALKIRYTSLPPPVRVQFYVNDSTASCLRKHSPGIGISPFLQPKSVQPKSARYRSLPVDEILTLIATKINTALQLLLMGATTVGQLVSPEAGFTLLDKQLTVDLALTGLQ